MAKDDRKIHNGVRGDGVTYVPGMEDELAAALSQEQLDRLVEHDALSGEWVSTSEDNGGETEEADVDKMDKKQLIEFAKANDIKIDSKAPKSEIAQIIKDALAL